MAFDEVKSDDVVYHVWSFVVVVRAVRAWTISSGTVELTVFPARRAEPSVQRGRCRDDNDTERHDRQEEAGSLG